MIYKIPRGRGPATSAAAAWLPMWHVKADKGVDYDDIKVDNYQGRSNPRVQIQPFCPRCAIVMLSRVQIRPSCPRGLNHYVS